MLQDSQLLGQSVQSATVDFNRQMLTELKTLARRSKFLSDALEAFSKKGYTFVNVQQEQNLPKEVAPYFRTNDVGAVTVPALQKIFVDPNAISRYAKESGTSDQEVLLSALGSELYHVTSKFVYSPLGPAQCISAIKEMRVSDKPTKTEMIYARLVQEQLAAHVIGEELSKLARDPSYKSKPDTAKASITSKRLREHLKETSFQHLYKLSLSEIETVSAETANMIRIRVEKLIENPKFNADTLHLLKGSGLFQ